MSRSISVWPENMSRVLPTIPDILTDFRDGSEDSLFGLPQIWQASFLHPRTLEYVGQWLATNGIPHVAIDHPPMDLQQKEHMYQTVKPVVGEELRTDEAIKPVKTVTLEVGRDPMLYIAITSLGRQVDKSVKGAIAQDLDTSIGKLKKAKTNPSNLHTELSIGLAPGIVSPLVKSSRAAQLAISAWYYIKEASGPDTPVEVAMSLVDSLVLPKRAFEELLDDFQTTVIDNSFIRVIETDPL